MFLTWYNTLTQHLVMSLLHLNYCTWDLMLEIPLFVTRHRSHSPAVSTALAEHWLLLSRILKMNPRSLNSLTVQSVNFSSFIFMWTSLRYLFHPILKKSEWNYTCMGLNETIYTAFSKSSINTSVLLASWALQGELGRKLYFKLFVEQNLEKRANNFSTVTWKSRLKDALLWWLCVCVFMENRELSAILDSTGQIWLNLCLQETYRLERKMGV